MVHASLPHSQRDNAVSAELQVGLDGHGVPPAGCDRDTHGQALRTVIPSSRQRAVRSRRLWMATGSAFVVLLTGAASAGLNWTRSALIPTGQWGVHSLIQLQNGEVISGGSDGTLRRWRDGKPVDGGTPISTGHGQVNDLLELKNGDVISAGSDGTLRWWYPYGPVPGGGLPTE